MNKYFVFTGVLASIFFFLVQCELMAHGEESASIALSKEHKGVRITLTLDKDVLSPGEDLNIRIQRDTLQPRESRFPRLAANGIRISIRTPNGSEFSHPHKSSPLITPNRILDKRSPMTLLNKRIHFVDSSNRGISWYIPNTNDNVRPNFRHPGVYSLSATYSVPQYDFLQDAWVGTIELPPLHFEVREIPVEQRLLELTEEQAEIVRLIEMTLAGKELPEGSKISGDKIRGMLSRTENEGLAVRLVELMQKHIDTLLVGWPKNPDWLVGRVTERAFDGTVIRIRGPYLPMFAQYLVDRLGILLEHTDREPRHLRLLFAYLRDAATTQDHAQQLREQMSAMAKEHAAKDYVWPILLELRVLEDGMLESDAIELLGEPNYRYPHGQVSWAKKNPSRKPRPSITADVKLQNGVNVLIFKRYDD